MDGCSYHCRPRDEIIVTRFICVTDDHGCLPFVVSTILSFLHSLFIIGVCKKRNTWGAINGTRKFYSFTHTLSGIRVN